MALRIPPRSRLGSTQQHRTRSNREDAKQPSVVTYAARHIHVISVLHVRLLIQHDLRLSGRKNKIGDRPIYIQLVYTYPKRMHHELSPPIRTIHNEDNHECPLIPLVTTRTKLTTRYYQDQEL